MESIIKMRSSESQLLREDSTNLTCQVRLSLSSLVNAIIIIVGS